MNRIIFYAPLGVGIPKERLGGAEVGCNRTKSLYEKLGFEVLSIPKPAIAWGIIKCLISFIKVPFQIASAILNSDRKAVVHIVGFYRNSALYELLLVKMVKFMNRKCIYEIRNGSFVSAYNERSGIYKFIIKHLSTEPDMVLCQGMEYVDFIFEKWNIKRDYYPNFIQDKFIFKNLPREVGSVRLIYFGRINELKRTDIVLEVLSGLRKRGYDATLDIIGAVEETYQLYLNGIIQCHDLSKFVTFHGRQPLDYIVSLLRKADYFVFPSVTKQEGHSNSLTEAMACGVIPICSNAGFNRSICGDDRLIVDDIISDLFIDRIVEIETLNLRSEYSEKMYNRIIGNFTESIVTEKLHKALKRLSDGNN